MSSAKRRLEEHMAAQVTFYICSSFVLSLLLSFSNVVCFFILLLVALNAFCCSPFSLFLYHCSCALFWFSSSQFTNFVPSLMFLHPFSSSSSQSFLHTLIIRSLCSLTLSCSIFIHSMHLILFSLCRALWCPHLHQQSWHCCATFLSQSNCLVNQNPHEEKDWETTWHKTTLHRNNINSNNSNNNSFCSSNNNPNSHTKNQRNRFFVSRLCLCFFLYIFFTSSLVFLSWSSFSRWGAKNSHLFEFGQRKQAT
jgi:hypothetical protein